MFRSLLLLPLLAVAPFGLTAPTMPEPPAPKVPEGYHQVKLNGHTFTLPEGLTIELAAGSDLAPRPISAAFDEKGRLYVTDSSGSNEKVAEQVIKKPHRIVRLEDTDGDGKFDKQTIYVKNIMFPEGALWLNGSLFVAAPPYIMKYTDSDDDGHADKEEVWFNGTSLGHCANDLHGPYLGPDGRVYWCKGAWAQQTYTLPSGKKWTTRASHMFRAKPDGTHIEPVMTGGMDNPVGTAFMPAGERIFSTTFFQRPADGKRDGLIHAIYGGIYGKDGEPIYEHPWTSPTLMPVLTHMGPAAPCGMIRFESKQFDHDYENNLFCCQFNLRKVSRHILTSSGSTFVSKDSDFLTSDNLDFHPTDVLEDIDGTLLIVDTGGWYKLCCPTSQLVKPDVTGAIYRVKKVGSHKFYDPRGKDIDWAKAPTAHFLMHIGDDRPFIRKRAIQTLVARGEEGFKLCAALAASMLHNERQRLNAVWALAHADTPHNRQAIRKSLVDNDATVLCAALHVIALWRDREAAPEVKKLLQHQSAFVRRAAAEALGRCGDPKAVPAILDALADDANDRALDHSLTYALIEIADAKQTGEGLSRPSQRVRRAALAAIDGMVDGNIDPKAVLAELEAKDAALRETAWWIAARHPQWGDQLAGYFADRLKEIVKMTPPEQDELVGRCVPFLKSDPVRKAVGDALAGTTNATASRAILRGLARSGLKVFPAEWTSGVMLALNTGNDDTVKEALSVLRSVPPAAADATEFIAQVPAYRQRVGTTWLKEHDYALRATAPAGARLTLAAAEGPIADIHRDRNGPVRAAAADLLTRATLVPEALIHLADRLKTANAVEVPKLLPAFAKSTDEKVGMALIAAVSEPALRNVVRVEQVKPIFDKCPKSVRDAAEKLYILLGEARQGERDKLERLLKEMPPGDIRRGQLIFNGSKALCSTCHKIGYVGGLIGPDLTKIGNIRNERDLLEAIVFPSASFVRSYEPVKVTTAAGRTLNGILKKDAPDEIILVVAADKEERIARPDVEEIVPGSISIMPAGFEQNMSPQEIADLVAFLKACK